MKVRVCSCAHVFLCVRAQRGLHEVIRLSRLPVRRAVKKKKKKYVSCSRQSAGNMLI